MVANPYGKYNSKKFGQKIPDSPLARNADRNRKKPFHTGTGSNRRIDQTLDRVDFNVFVVLSYLADRSFRRPYNLTEWTMVHRDTRNRIGIFHPNGGNWFRNGTDHHQVCYGVGGNPRTKYWCGNFCWLSQYGYGNGIRTRRTNITKDSRLTLIDSLNFKFSSSCYFVLLSFRN